MMISGSSFAADDWNIDMHRHIKSNIVLLSSSGEMLASPKAVRLGAMGTRRNAGALPRGERYLRLVEAIPVSSNARAHACNQIDSRGARQAYFMRRDVFVLAHPGRFGGKIPGKGPPLHGHHC